MQPTKTFGIVSFLAILIAYALLVAGGYFLQTGRIQIPAGDREIAVLAASGAVALVLWLVLLALGRSTIRRAAAGDETGEEEEDETETESPRDDGAREETAAVQMLSLLQRQGRLIDFLQEDLTRHDDAQIGAAVRSIHAGMKEALTKHVVLEPVFEEAEGADVTIKTGFDRHAIRLTGDVAGDPPFRGELRHRGWRVVRVDLPKRTWKGDDRRDILAPAEVEVKARATPAG